MRVLHIIGQVVPGGSEKVTVQIAREFIRRGCEHEVAVLSVADRDFVTSLEAQEVPLHVLGARRRVGPLRTASILRSIARITRDVQPEVIQGHAWRSSVAAGLVGQTLLVPAIATLHRIYYPRLEITADRFLQRLWRAVVVDSDAVRNLLSARAGILESRIRVIPNFVSPHLFAIPENGTDFDDDRPLRILMAGHFTDVKGHRFLVDALAELEKERPGRFELDLLGDGPLLDETRARARDAGVSHAVRFHGSRSDLGAWLESADIVVLPSLWEGFGLILAEAAASARPAVSFAIGGAAEVIVNSETGLLVPPGDVPGLANALARLYADPALRSRLAHAARLRAARLYAMEPVLNRYETLYASVQGMR
jgi:glycosyltransferase involved in cell wall biosynthesis